MIKNLVIRSESARSKSNLNLTIGQSFGGGYYAGTITDNGVSYHLIIAPKESGRNNGNTIQWKLTNDASPVATETLTNGLYSSFSIDATNYPAVHYCRGLNIGGFTDWYLPSRDELELVYRNFKPSSSPNNVFTRSSATYGISGFGVDNQGNGTNINSTPVGTAYTSTFPVQTNLSIFKAGGLESLVSGSYWTSTEVSSTDVWVHSMLNGAQNISSKTSNNYVCAFRRALV